MSDDNDDEEFGFGAEKPDRERQKPYVVSLHTIPLTELQKDVAIFKHDLPEMIEFYKYEAKLTRSRYLALLKEGFSPGQALKLCRMTSGG